MLIKFIDTIEKLAKSKNLSTGSINAFTREILEKAASALNCERSNAWVFNEDETELISLNAYISSKKKFTKEPALKRVDLPRYFSYLIRNNIIVADNARDEEMNAELVDVYLNPLNITAMIDVPIRSEGRMIGVICFEHVKKKHHWLQEEKKFAQSVSQLLSLSLESKRRKNYQKRLEGLVEEKELLLSEINHRVKNNMAVIMSLLNLQKAKCLDEFHVGLFDEIKDKVYSMSSLQEQLHASENVNSIDLGTYLERLINNLNKSYGLDKSILIKTDFEKVNLDVTRAIPCGLIANEILTNSFKYAFGEENNQPKLSLKIRIKDKKLILNFKDNGPGIGESTNEIGMGLEIINDLAKQIGGRAIIKSGKGTNVKLIL